MSSNLALNKQIEITEFAPIPNEIEAREHNDALKLTNGKTASANDIESQWVRFCRGVGRELMLDLGRDYAIDGFEMGFLQNREQNIVCPECVRLLLSDNGEDFCAVSRVDSPYPASFSLVARANYRSNFASKKARYIKIVFEVESAAYCDAVKVFGRECDGSEDALAVPSAESVGMCSYAPRNALDGVCDLPLVQIGVDGADKDSFLPFLAYISDSGCVSDTMFDSILIESAQRSMANLSDWESWIDSLFADGLCLDALDRAVAELKSRYIFPKDYRHKVFLKAPIPEISLVPFGDLNRDGIEEKMLSTEDCIEAMTWFVSEIARRFAVEGLQNIEICGFVWNRTELNRYRDDSDDLIAGFVSKVKSLGYKCIAVADFQAGGLNKNEKFGFDCITMSPSENEGTGMEAFSQTCKRFGLGADIPIRRDLSKDEFDERLRACVNNGMMQNTVHTYRVEMDYLTDLAYSQDEKARSVYNKLYKFVKCALNDADFVEEPKEEPKGEFSEESDFVESESATQTMTEPESEPDVESVIEAEAEPIAEVEHDIEIETETESEPETDSEDSSVCLEKNKAPRRARATARKRTQMQSKKKSINKYAIGASLTAAAVGLAYIINKLKDD